MPSTVPIALISKIRSMRPGTPLSLARAALVHASNDLPAAMAYLESQAELLGTAKATKLAGRKATEGLIGIAVMGDGTGGMGVRAAMVEINCETDFVARTEQFGKCVEAIARSLAFFAEPLEGEGVTGIVKRVSEDVGDTPLVPDVGTVVVGKVDKVETIKSTIASTIAILGESISLRRACTIALTPALSEDFIANGSTQVLGSYSHNNSPSSSSSSSNPSASNTTYSAGTRASLVLALLPRGGHVEKPDIKTLLRALARQVVAVPTSSVSPPPSATIDASEEMSTSLYRQPIMTFQPTPTFEFEAGTPVEELLKAWSANKGLESSLEVQELERWIVGSVGEAEDQ